MKKTPGHPTDVYERLMENLDVGATERRREDDDGKVANEWPTGLQQGGGGGGSNQTNLILDNQAFMLSPEPGIVPDQPTLLCEMLDRLLQNVLEAEKALCALCHKCTSGAEAEQIQRAKNNLMMATCDFREEAVRIIQTHADDCNQYVMSMLTKLHTHLSDTIGAQLQKERDEHKERMRLINIELERTINHNYGHSSDAQNEIAGCRNEFKFKLHVMYGVAALLLAAALALGIYAWYLRLALMELHDRALKECEDSLSEMVSAKIQKRAGEAIAETLEWIGQVWS